MKLTKAVLAASAILALTACGSGEEKAPEATAPEAAPAEAVAPVAEAPAAPAETPAPEAVPAEAAPAATQEVATAPAAKPSGPPDSFLVCSSCHAVEAGKHGIGPSLAGIYGKKAGSVAGASYSDALKNSGLVWNDANLDKWLQAPMKMVPGTRMGFAGVPDAAKRKELIAYMKSL